MTIQALESHFVEDLQTLHKIAETLNRAIDVTTALESALAQLVELMGLRTAWIFLKDEKNQSRWAGKGYELIAHHNLPPAMRLTEAAIWNGGCDCQGFCNRGQLTQAYNEVKCSRLAAAHGNTYGLTVHASVPLKSGDTVLGILNVAGETWGEFTPRALALLTNVGSLLGITLERAHLYDLLKTQRQREQRAFFDLSNIMLGEPNLKKMTHYMVEEVQRLLNVDACTIMLEDDRHEYLTFRAAYGWRTDPVRSGAKIPVAESKVMKTKAHIVVEDIDFSDPTPWMSDWFKNESFRGHAVVPLVIQNRSIGLMVVNTRERRLLDDDEMRLLQLLANQTALAIEKTRFYDSDVKHRHLKNELEVGQRIQLSMLPESCPKVHGWQFAAAYEAAKQVGGDFYDFFRIPDENFMLGIVVADVADKGVPAALVMALSRTIIRNAGMSKTSRRSPREALLRANELMLEDTRSEMFLTAFYARLDVETGWMTYASAGHNPPLWYRAEFEEFQPLAIRGIVLGILEDIDLDEETISLASNDLVIMYTDGVTEALNSQMEEFGLERLKAVIQENAYKTADEVQAAIMEAVLVFAATTPQTDDMTLVVVKRE